MTKFKKMIQQKLSGNLSGEFFSIHNEINSIIIEMGKQFDKILEALNKYFLEKNDKNTKEEYSSSSSSDGEGINHIKGKKDKRNSQVDSNINNLNDFNNPDYDFKERIKLDKKIKCPENIIKEMITTFTKKASSPVYFNEPISMCQKQCEKFIYLDLLNKACQIEDNKPLQMCFFKTFFANIRRNLRVLYK